MELKDKNLYFVGGVVRDEILGKPSFDIDYCYEGDAIEFSKGLSVIRTNPDFGTVRVLIDNKEVDIASTRQEFYPKAGHLPVVENIGCSLKDDLSRRDFTINAMAKNTLTGELVDYFSGLDDIKNRKLRVLHDKSFVDDPTRIIRALKFSVRFGFDLDSKTKKLQDDYLANINYDMSYYRLKKELKETFDLNEDLALERFIKDGIYKLLGNSQRAVLPQNSISELVEKYAPKNIWLVYLVAYNLEKIELTVEEDFIIKDYESVKNLTPDSDYEIFKLFKGKTLEAVIAYACYINYNIAIKYLDNLKNIKVAVTGDDLVKLGIPQGKIYKEIFNDLEKEKVLNPLMTYEEEIAYIKFKYHLFI